jgi:hypothetical protein
MKAEFELTLNNAGRPCIRFIHHDKDNSLEQLTLKIMLREMLANGIKISNPSGCRKVGTDESFEIYEISAL